MHSQRLQWAEPKIQHRPSAKVLSILHNSLAWHTLSTNLEVIMSEEELLDMRTGMNKDEREALARIYDHGFSLDSPISDIAKAVPPRLFFSAANLKNEYRRWEDSHEGDTPVGVQEGWD
jgi:hypothetical protein